MFQRDHIPWCTGDELTEEAAAVCGRCVCARGGGTWTAASSAKPGGSPGRCGIRLAAEVTDAAAAAALLSARSRLTFAVA